MKWLDLLDKILYDFRCNPNSLATKYNLKTFPMLYQSIKNGQKNISAPTIQKIEDALNIKIDYSDPENLTYTLKEETPQAPVPNKSDLTPDPKLLAEIAELKKDLSECKKQNSFFLDEIIELKKELKERDQREDDANIG